MKALITPILITLSFFGFANTTPTVDSSSNAISQTHIEITQKRNVIQLSEVISRWSIVSKTGQVVLSGTSTNSINLESLPIGAYLLKIEDQTFKVIAIKKVYKF